jgi:hypothetical protein
VLQVAEISARFAFTDGVVATFSDTLEVSLDCCICHRCRCTVIFKVDGAEGKCTPTGHPFPGKIVAMEASAGLVVYRLEYWYESFVDAKYPDRRKAQNRPTWGRIGFDVVCPKCRQTSHQSTQNNIVRPWSCACKCGQLLFTESDEMPILR